MGYAVVDARELVDPAEYIQIVAEFHWVAIPGPCSSAFLLFILSPFLSYERK
jgi:hypothetical protein